MKLVFPGGEHPQVLLGQGVNRVGSHPEATIVLDRPGVLPQHCQLHVSAHGVMLDVAHGNSVSVNGRQVNGLITLRSGDTVAFDTVQAHLASLDTTQVDRNAGLAAECSTGAANDDPGATAVRPVLPKYLLRGITGSVEGQNFRLLGPTTVGRAGECEWRLDEKGMSRKHARLVPTAQGLQIEDLGSTNGSYINRKRVVSGEALPGDEVSFDTVRFRLISTEPLDLRADARDANAESEPHARRWWLWLALAAVALIGYAAMKRLA